MEINIIDYNYEAIKYFISVAYHGSLSRAAHTLGISQSALSQSMKNLEQSLKIKLFNRNTRGIILTREGKLLYEIAKIGDNYFKEAIIQTIRTNKLISLKTFKITAAQSILNTYVIPVMKKIVFKYSDVNFEIGPYVSEKEIVNKIQNNEVDLIIDKVNEKFISKEVISRKITDHNYYFTYNPKVLNFNSSMDISNLESYPIILKDRIGKNGNTWMKTTFNQVITCRSDEIVLDLIRKGIGIGLCPKELADKEGLQTIELEEYTPTKRTVEAFYLESNIIAKEFVDEIINSIK